MGKSNIKFLAIVLNMIVGVLLLVSCVSNTNSEVLKKESSLETHKIYGASIQLKTGPGVTYEGVFINDKDSSSKKPAKINYTCKVVILEESADWIKVCVVEPEYLREDYTGWIPRKHIEIPPEDPKMNEVLKIYEANVKAYGEITAGCIRDQEIRVGMKEEGLKLINKPVLKRVNRTETMYGVRKQYVYYGNMYVYVDDGIVTAIQS
ncbi:MAG: hypothetical protein CVU12_05565 [Bacteroidetes bacterium HGW-Bacteroidetes-7]|jgi:hypothetical protein|nr:MAG: hypothetical protein CVU12_05565 [Bacteroidetes bacterium HGW-Bacteroidetes-7]